MTIGVPIVRSYGSSFGTYNGMRLEDYKQPEPKASQAGDSLATDVVERATFKQSVKDFVFARLGYPVIAVELTDFQVETCIDEAIAKLDYYSPQWMTQFAVIDASAGINIYELPPEVANNLTECWYKKSLFNIAVTPGSLEYDFTIMFFTNTGLFNNYNVGEYVLMQQYLKQVRKVLGQGGDWKIVNGKYLHIWPTPDGAEDIILEFRGIDSNTLLPAYRNWINRYSLAVAKEILGRIRGKFQTLPGPGGGARLDGDTLSREAIEEKEKLMEELMTAIDHPPLIDFW